jgi:hypothetical protein
LITLKSKINKLNLNLKILILIIKSNKNMKTFQHFIRKIIRNIMIKHYKNDNLYINITLEVLQVYKLRLGFNIVRLIYYSILNRHCITKSSNC